MYNKNITTRLFSTLSARTGLLGAALLGVSYALNPGPPEGITDVQLVAFGQQHFTMIVWGAWLQAVGPFLIILFALALVHLAGATQRLAGWMTMVGAIILMMVSLTEVVFYLSALYTQPASMALISSEIAHAIQHLYFIVAAPALFIPLGLVILSSTILPRALGYFALAFGAAFFILGMVSLSSLILSAAVTSLAAIQAAWWLAAAFILLFRARKMPKDEVIK